MKKSKEKPSTTFHDMYFTAVKELQFANMQVEYLLSVLDEIESFSGTLESAVIANAREKHYLDKNIHAKLLFKEPDLEEIKDNINKYSRA